MSFSVRIEDEQGSLKLLLHVEGKEEAQKIYNEMVNKLYRGDDVIMLLNQDFTILKVSGNNS